MNRHPYELFFQAIGHPSRLAILQLLQKGSHSVLQMVEKLNMEQSAVSHNLQCLSRCGFIQAERKGKKRIYSLNRPVTEKLLSLIDDHIHKFQNEFVACGILQGRDKCC